MYNVLNDYVGSTLKESLARRNHMQTSYNLRNSHTNLAFPKPKREFQKRALNIVGLSFGVVSLLIQNWLNQFI